MLIPQIRCPKGADELKLLVHHHMSGLYMNELRARFPKLKMVVLENYADLQVLLKREQPDVVLSFRMGHLGPFPRATLIEWPSIKWLHATGAGIEHLPPWDPRKITITNSSGIHGSIMAEYAAWAVLNQTQKMPLFAAQHARREWRLYPVDPVAGKTVVIVGMGRVGGEIARRLRAFGMRIVGVRNRSGLLPAADETYTTDRLPEALAKGDFVILVTPLTDRTRGLFDARMLGYCKHGAHFINLARGNIVNEEALRGAIKRGALSGATFDVFHTEPLPHDDPMWSADGVIVTPHVSGEVANWQAVAARLFMENLDRWLSGQPLVNLCDPELGY